MKYLIMAAALVVALGAVGYWAGWWNGTVQIGSGSVSGKVSVDADEIVADRDKFVADTQKKLDDLDAKFKQMTADAKADAKPKYEAMKQSLAKSRDQLAENLSAAKSATKEKWKDVRARAESAWTELSDGFAKATEELKK